MKNEIEEELRNENQGTFSSLFLLATKDAIDIAIVALSRLTNNLREALLEDPRTRALLEEDGEHGAKEDLPSAISFPPQEDTASGVSASESADAAGQDEPLGTAENRPAELEPQAQDLPKKRGALPEAESI